MSDQQPAVAAAVDEIAPRLRSARERKGVTLAELSRSTGVSTSTLSRLESGQRKPSLELLLPITAALGLRLDEVVSAPRILDPRVPQDESRMNRGRVMISLSRQQGEPRAYS